MEKSFGLKVICFTDNASSVIIDRFITKCISVLIFSKHRIACLLMAGL